MKFSVYKQGKFLSKVSVSKLKFNNQKQKQIKKKKIFKMKTFVILFAIVAVVAAYEHGSSYVSRKDANHPAHGHHDDHHDSYHYPSYKYEVNF